MSEPIEPERVLVPWYGVNVPLAQLARIDPPDETGAREVRPYDHEVMDPAVRALAACGWRVVDRDFASVTVRFGG